MARLRKTDERATRVRPRLGTAERDLVALGIALAAILMFVGTGSSVLPQVIRSLSGVGAAPDRLLINALLLNIALIIFGWRRYNQLMREIEERRKAEAQARSLAETDPLTGFLNRRGISDMSDEMLAVCRTRGELLVFMMVDLDNFKRVTDLNGHSIGDVVLVECARRIAAQLPPEALLARLGGDEFACVLPVGTRLVHSVESLAERLIAEIAEIYAIQGYETEILAASVRHTRHIVDAARAGADVITSPLQPILGLLNHPLTDNGLEKFLADHRKAAGK